MHLKQLFNYHVTDTSFLTSGDLEHYLRFAQQFSVPQPQVQQDANFHGRTHYRGNIILASGNQKYPMSQTT